MTDSKTANPGNPPDWGTYWQGAGGRAAVTHAGVASQVLGAFWRNFFSAAKRNIPQAKILDLASGNGAVVEFARDVYEGKLEGFTCVDSSAQAIAALVDRFPGITGTVADAGDLPLESESFNVVTSQFGLEYASPTALVEAARVVAPGGLLALIMHYRDGGIYRECAASAETLQTLADSQFIDRARRLFEAGFAVCDGGEGGALKAASEEMAKAMREVEAMVARHGTEVAGGAVARFHADVTQIAARIQVQERDQVMPWLDAMEKELLAYQGRMRSMLDAALDAQDFRQVCADLQPRGLGPLTAQPLAVSGGDAPLAWLLVARKT